MGVCVEDRAVGPEGFGEGRRDGAAAFESAITRMESAVADSCAEVTEWPARVSAGLEAVIDFLVANPGTARSLAVDTRLSRPEEGRYDEMIARFAHMLGDGAPHMDQPPGPKERSIVSVIAGVVGSHVRSGTVGSLAKGDPDLVFLALLPYLGFAEASRWAAPQTP
jgi:hypothetical protein